MSCSTTQMARVDQCAAPFCLSSWLTCRSDGPPRPSFSSLQLVEQLLYESLQLCQAEAAHLQHDAMHLISPRLVEALLGNHRGMTHRTKQAGAQLVFLVRPRGCCLAGCMGISWKRHWLSMRVI